MASNESYLITALAKYNCRDAVHREVLNIFQAYKDLRPSLEHFTFNDGSSKELLNLAGTIPVTYKGHTYNIPVIIWLLETHPYNPPMCFVKPTSDMQIKSNQNVDANGRVTLPYLREWKPNSSDLLGLIQIMVIVFGEEPPVYSRPKQAPYPSYSSHQQTGFMNMPSVNPVSYPTSYPQSRPSYPPKTSYDGYSNYPSYNASYPSYGSTNQAGYAPYPPPTSTYSGTSLPYPIYSAGSYPHQPSQPTPMPSQPNSSNASTITEQHIRVSLLTAVEDKLKRKLRDVVSQSQAEVDALKRTQEDLKQGRDKINYILGSLEKEMNELNKNIRILEDKTKEAQEVNEKLSKQKDYEIDDAVVTTAPLYKQLLNSFAEENATEDAIYYLGEALRRGVIDLDVFLKHVRQLSRKQFMLRAIMQKCRQKAGLAY